MFSVGIHPSYNALVTLSFTNDRMKPGSLQTQALALQQNFLHYLYIALLLSYLMSLGTMRQYMKYDLVYKIF